MTGNGFIIFLVCSRRHLRTKTNDFVVSLGVADFCVGMNVVPLLFFLELEQSHSQGLEKGLKLVRWLFQDASVMNMCISSTGSLHGSCQAFEVPDLYDFHTC